MSTTPPPRPTLAPVTADFNSLDPDEAYTAQEQRGDMAWTGAALPYIEDVSFPQPTTASLPIRMQALIKNVWGVQPSAGAGRGNIQIGQGSSYRGEGPRTAPGRQEAHYSRIGWLPTTSGPATRSPAEVFASQGYKDRTAPYVSPPRVTVAPLTAPADPTQQKALAQFTNGLNWKVHNDFKLVNAYTFRGDRRGPDDLRQAGGMQPPITRTDQHYIDNVIYPQFLGFMQRQYGLTNYVDKPTFLKVFNNSVGADASVMRNYLVWWSVIEQEGYHVGKMVVDETLKGYTSSTRAVTVAKGYARTNGWVYVLQIEAGFLLPSKGKHKWTEVFGEEEIAKLGPVPWERIVGFRQVGAGNMFTGQIFLRKRFQRRAAQASKAVYELLSGKPQH